MLSAVHRALQPLYLAACSSICCHDPDSAYNESAWAATERALFSSFCSPRNWQFFPVTKYSYDAAIHPDMPDWVLIDPDWVRGKRRWVLLYVIVFNFIIFFFLSHVVLIVGEGQYT